MAKQSVMELIIKLCGKEDSTFSALGKKVESFGNLLTGMGAKLTAITAPAVMLGKKTLDLYTDYDDVMRAIQAVGDYTTDQMEKVSAAARQAGRDTRYTATDAGNAFLYLTQAGVGLQDAVGLLPTTLNAAAAGQMGLADTTDLLISNLYSLGKTFDNETVTAYLDQVTTAADSTNTTLAELMAGVSKLGAAGQMFSSDTELLTFLGMMANLNAKGTTGGVNARNMIISLLAPTNKAADLMEALAISEEEMDEALEDIDLTDSAEAIEQLGLKTVDATGKARPMVDILTDLNSALTDMTDDEKANVLYSIFGKRTYPVVAGLLGMLEQYPDLFEKIQGSMGSTQKKAETMESGIGGRLRMLKSSAEEVLIAIGEAADEKAGSWFDSLRDLMLTISGVIGNLSEAQVNTILDVISTLAVAGPALMVGGTAFKIIGDGIALFGTTTGKILLAAAAVGILATALSNMNAENVKEAVEKHFGSLEFDMEYMKEYFTGLSSEFETGAANLTKYKEAIDGASSAYTTAVTGLSAGMLDAVFRNVTLTETDKAALSTYAENMVTELQTALATRKLQIGDLIDLAFNGDNEGDAQKNSAWSTLVDSIFSGLNDEAAAASQELRDNLTKALQDGYIDDTERQAIAASQQRMSQIMAEITSYQNEFQASVAYAKATDMSWGSIQEHFDMVTKMRQESDAATADAFANLSGLVYMAQKRGAAIPQQLQDAYGIGEYDYEGAYSAVNAERDAQMLDNRMEADAVNARIASYAMNQLNSEGLLTPMYTIADEVLSGAMTLEDAFEQADDLLFNMNGKTKKNMDMAMDAVSETIFSYFDFDTLRSIMERQIETEGTLSEDYYNLYRSYIANGLFNGLTTYDDNNDGVNELYMNGAYMGLESDISRYAQYAGKYKTGMQEELDNDPPELTIEQPDAAADAMAYVQAAQSTLDANPVTVRVIQSHVSVGGGIGGTNGGSVGESAKMLYYAEGGRSDVPAVFGEAGAEWAIPEEHTQRTAQLLASAAKASGFTFSELLQRTGGLGGRESAAVSFTFAPTIYAQDARGVSDALEKGKREMEAWFEARSRREERMSFA